MGSVRSSGKGMSFAEEFMGKAAGHRKVIELYDSFREKPVWVFPIPYNKGKKGLKT